jgi:hypothetical protein
MKSTKENSQFGSDSVVTVGRVVVQVGVVLAEHFAVPRSHYLFSALEVEGALT